MGIFTRRETETQKMREARAELDKVARILELRRPYRGSRRELEDRTHRGWNGKK